MVVADQLPVEPAGLFDDLWVVITHLVFKAALARMP
jgi:hypothetical protein